MYVDDSGEKEYGTNTSRYFVYAGVVVSVADEPQFNEVIADAKQACFGRTDVELKSNWLRIQREREKRYLSLDGVTDEKLTVMVKTIYAWAVGADLQLVAAVIDKRQMQEKYVPPRRPWHPSAAAYLFLLQRFQKHLGRCNGLGYVTVDDMEGASPAQNQWRDLLRGQHQRLKRDGCSLTKLRFDNVAAEFRFGDSKRFNLLQLADIVAYSVLRQFRDYGENWDDPLKGDLPMYPWLRPLLPRFMRGPANQLQGWGIVKWPALHAGRWCLTPEELRGA